MFLEFPQDRELTTTDAEFMFGNALLVAPKLTERVETMQVRLPEGNWYDFWTGNTIKGGATLSVDPALDVLPLYVRAGAIIAKQATIQYVGETPQGPLQVHVYPGPHCHGAVYADDGNTFAYKRGDFQRTSFTCQATVGEVRVNISAPEGSYRPWWQSFEVTVHGAQAAPRAVTLNGSQVSGVHFEAAARMVAVSVPASKATEIIVHY
jgi:alpha-glucosidase